MTTKLSALELRGLAALLAEAIEILQPEFGRVVGNGDCCRICGAHGFGIPEPHAPTCRGVAALGDLREAESLLRQTGDRGAKET